MEASILGPVCIPDLFKRCSWPEFFVVGRNDNGEFRDVTHNAWNEAARAGEVGSGLNLSGNAKAG
jgi:hypothetical protein